VRDVRYVPSVRERAVPCAASGLGERRWPVGEQALGCPFGEWGDVFGPGGEGLGELVGEWWDGRAKHARHLARTLARVRVERRRRAKRLEALTGLPHASRARTRGRESPGGGVIECRSCRSQVLGSGVCTPASSRTYARERECAGEMVCMLRQAGTRGAAKVISSSPRPIAITQVSGFVDARTPQTDAGMGGRVASAVTFRTACSLMRRF